MRPEDAAVRSTPTSSFLNGVDLGHLGNPSEGHAGPQRQILHKLSTWGFVNVYGDRRGGGRKVDGRFSFVCSMHLAMKTFRVDPTTIFSVLSVLFASDHSAGRRATWCIAYRTSMG